MGVTDYREREWDRLGWIEGAAGGGNIPWRDLNRPAIGVILGVPI